MTTLEDALQEVREWTVHRLADELNHGPVSLDSGTSPGAEFLDSVRSAFIEAVENNGAAILDGGEWFETADGAVPVYTYRVWTTFTDLVAWQSDHAEEVEGLTTESAMAVLYYIAEEMCQALAQHVREAIDDQDDMDDEYTEDGEDGESDTNH